MTRLMAVTPSKVKSMPLEEVRKICYDYTVTGLETVSSLKRDSQKPFRFVYVSGAKAERDQTQKPWILGDYTILRVCFLFFSFGYFCKLVYITLVSGMR